MSSRRGFRGVRRAGTRRTRLSLDRSGIVRRLLARGGDVLITVWRELRSETRMSTDLGIDFVAAVSEKDEFSILQARRSQHTVFSILLVVRSRLAPENEDGRPRSPAHGHNCQRNVSFETEKDFG